jgi:hypothetical protein
VTLAPSHPHPSRGILEVQEVDGVAWPLVVALAVAVLCVAGLMGHLDRVGSFLARAWSRIHPPPPRPETVSVEHLVSDLRRLAVLLEQTYDTEQPAKMARLTAASLAYDYVLLSACRTLEIDLPHTPPLEPVARLETEAELARQGLQW